MSIAHAADAANGIAAASSRQLTLSAMLLIGLTLLVTTAFALWSWRRRESLSLRRREAELALRTSEDRLRQISGQLPVALFEYVASPLAEFRSISEGVARLLPATATQITADPQVFFDAIHAEDIAGLTWRYGTMPPGRDFEWIGRSRTSAGAESWLQIRSTTELTAEGQPAIHGVMLDVTALKHMQQALERSREELRRLAAHRESGIEKERARLAREVHDELGQVLTAARMQLQLLRSELGESATPRIADTEALIGEAYRSVKSIAADLRPGALNLGLTAAVEWLTARLLTPAKIACSIQFSAEADTLSEEQSIGLFRIVQESLGNVVRHSGATKVVLEFNRCPGGYGALRLVIHDNGHGFNPAAVDRREHFGLLGMVERVEALGGTLTVSSQPNSGTILTVDLSMALPA